MPITRSASRASVSHSSSVNNTSTGISVQEFETNPSPTGKRKLGETSFSDSKLQRLEKKSLTESRDKPPSVLKSQTDLEQNSVVDFIPAVLTFSFEEAKNHLIEVDPRFGDLFNKVKCRPYEHLERVDPFRTLTTTIIGQQISWKAARSIRHRFIRLFDPSLPEKPAEINSNESRSDFFPSAHQVASTTIETLRTAGLSGRKAEYVHSLAENFADGHLSTSKIMEATDEQLYEMLIPVKGIGRWTIDMFAIFSLRRPDILPVGDLGVQRGLLRWFLARYSPEHPLSVSSDNLVTEASDDVKSAENGAEQFVVSDTDLQLTELEQSKGAIVPPNMSSVLPASAPSTPQKKRTDNGESSGIFPIPSTPFTPSIEKTLNKIPESNSKIPALPEMITIELLKSRLISKKKIKGAMLTPNEMEDLTESWRPYRSIGIYYMWKLAEPAFQ